HTLPKDAQELGRVARRVGVQGPPARAAREFQARHRAVTRAVHRAFREFFADRELAPRRRVRLASLTGLRATGFKDPERARHNLQLILEGRLLARKWKPAMRQALAAVFAPETTAIERRDRLRRVKQAEELAVVWRYVLGVTTIDAYSREMTALAEATLAAGWLLALESLVAR